MSDLIDRQATIEAICEVECVEKCCDEPDCYLARAIKNVPFAEPKTGKWLPCTEKGLLLTEMAIREGQKWYGYKCSNCGFIYDDRALIESPFCQKCGARMTNE